MKSETRFPHLAVNAQPGRETFIAARHEFGLRAASRPAGFRISDFGLRIFLPVLLAIFFCAGARGKMSVIDSVHNLTASGPGSVKAKSETDACVFCHTAHHANGQTPLWNHAMSAVSNYVVYSSARFTNLDLVVPQPNGSSRLCLSCHDGTVALGSVSSSAMPIEMQNDVTTLASVPGTTANLGTDLSADHPISFYYDLALYQKEQALGTVQIKDPGQPAVAALLDRQGRLQCTACHDPHDNEFGDFLVMDNTGSALCLVCHEPGPWLTSAHAISPAAVPPAIAARANLKASAKSGSARAMSPTVATLACGNCHASHRAGSPRHLLLSDMPEQNCYACHRGFTATKNIAADFQKASIHPVTFNSKAHSPVEDPINPPQRHVVCADCHNSHAVNAARAVAPNASGALARLTGVAAGGAVIRPLLKEYELCFRCHADSVARGPATVPRQFVQTNTRLQFSTANQSFHPVEAIGKNTLNVPSLISPWRTTSLMYCTDCHNSDSGPKAGGSGANGPHGSIYRPILERNLVITDYQPESAAAYALCYKCHSRPVVLSSQSFLYHKTHVVDDQAACTTCHDSHGVANTPHLINFNTTYVTPSSNGRLEYVSTGPLHGNCSLTCHGKDHPALSY